MEVFYKACPGCGGILSSKEMISNGICKSCMKKGLCKSIPWLCSIREKVAEFELYFTEKVGKLTPLQKQWATRFFLGLSFSMTAPPGLGKTTFAMHLASFLSDKGLKSYLIFPTKALVNQTAERLEMAGADGVFKYPGMDKELLFNGKFKIAVTTSAFFHRNYTSIPKIFSMVFVDDVDSFMKFRSNVEKILEVSKNATLIMSSATAKPKPQAVRLLMEKKGFLPAKPLMPFRNVIDCLSHKEPEKIVSDLVSAGYSGIVLEASRKLAEERITKLRKAGIKAFIYEDLEEFKQHGEVIVGIAKSMNPLVRGIDLPEKIRFVLFSSVPKHEIVIEEINEKNAKIVAMAISPLFPDVWKWRNDLPERLREILSKEENIERINSSPEVSIRSGKLIFADVTTYIQASGRASRLTKEGVTTGLSITVPDDEKAFSFLKRRLKWMYGIEFHEEWENYIKYLKEKKKVNPKSLVVIVESPTKAKTIASFFSKPGAISIQGALARECSYSEIMMALVPSKGHITDLSDEGRFGVSKNGPIFSIIEGKEDLIEGLRKLSVDTEVLIATDPDREGEKIAYDLRNMLTLFSSSISRIEFHEITKKAFLRAMNEKRDIDDQLVGAQLVRRIADRWIGFPASIDLQKSFGRKNMSAGRVQTPVLGWIIKRWEESKDKEFFAEFFLDASNGKIKFSIPTHEKTQIDKTTKVVVKVERKEEYISKDPLDTETMLRLSAKFFPPEQAMEIAQSLFEKGLITYHRTDSKRVSSTGIEIAREFIEREFGKEFFRANAGKGEGAHECIRPTKPFNPSEASSLFSLNRDEHLLYSIIFNNFIASQIRPVKVESLRVVVDANDLGQDEKVVYSKILEHGWDLVIPIKVVGEIKEGEKMVKIRLVKRPKSYPMTYQEVIGMMKERGIGRPSTYAITIEKLKSRQYIIETRSRKFLVPTKLGILAHEYLMKSKWKRWLEENYTAKLEKVMDKIEKGEIKWDKIIENLGNEIFGRNNSA